MFRYKNRKLTDIKRKRINYFVLKLMLKNKQLTKI